MRQTATLRRRILARKARVAVVGQGYVGLSLACVAADAGFSVIGVDLDPARVEGLRQGDLSVPGVDPDLFRLGVSSERLTFSTAAGEVGGADVIAICVPTPVKDGSPDLSHVERAGRDVGRNMSTGALVILESTTYPGTTEKLLCPLLEAGGKSHGSDFLLAYSPERIDPGNEEYGLVNTPRVVGGVTPEATGIGALFYGQLVDKVVSVSSSRAAELSKLLENTYRHVNIALVNEMAMLCHELDIDVWEVIDATASKPFGFMAFQPGPGVGGNCIPVDPRYLAWLVRRDVGQQFRALEQADDINAHMPAYTASRISDALNEAGKPLKGAHILVLGVAYKPNVGEAAQSPAVQVMQMLRRRKATVSFHDPFIARVNVGAETLDRMELTQRTVAGADCVALLTPHDSYDLDWIAERARLVFDARNAFGQARRNNVVRL